VVPNTAASKAGLKPGERLVMVDGRPATFRTWREWAAIRGQKRTAVSKSDAVTLALEVESADPHEIRKITLTLPSPPPHWGASPWRSPERAPAEIGDQGPLAELARIVMNNGVWTTFGWPFLNAKLPAEFVGKNRALFLGFYWTITDEKGSPHKIFVSQSRGRTDIILSFGGQNRSASVDYLTSPTAALEEAVVWPGRKSVALDKAGSGFRQEVEFWTKQVGKVSPRWPLELIRERP
jgi:hypothetical protein